MTDNGRGIPIDIHPKAGRPAIEVILTTLRGRQVRPGQLHHLGGLHGVGSSVVNALLGVDGGHHPTRRERMAPDPCAGRGHLRAVRSGPARGTGTRIQFTPDAEIFGDFVFDADAIFEHLEVSAFLNKGLRIVFKDEVGNRREDIKHDGGVVDYLAAQVERLQCEPTTDEGFSVSPEADPRIDLALAWTDRPRESFKSFVNGIPTRDGGTHEQGLRDGIVKAVRNYVETHDVSLPRGVKLTADDIREGVVAICSVFVHEPQFQGQTKDKLNNPEVRNGRSRSASRAGAVAEYPWLAGRCHPASHRQRRQRPARWSRCDRAGPAQVRRGLAAQSPRQAGGLLQHEAGRIGDIHRRGDSAGGSASRRDRRHRPSSRSGARC